MQLVIEEACDEMRVGVGEDFGAFAGQGGGVLIELDYI